TDRVATASRRRSAIELRGGYTLDIEEDIEDRLRADTASSLTARPAHTGRPTRGTRPSPPSSRAPSPNRTARSPRTRFLARTPRSPSDCAYVPPSPGVKLPPR